MSENLKIVEIACQKVDQRVNNIMKSLNTYGIPLQKIKICQTNKSLECKLTTFMLSASLISIVCLFMFEGWSREL